MDMQCMNCGLNGHKFRNCPKPILSYGIACFIQNKQLKEKKSDLRDDEWLCICIQRRHTYSYVDYIRGKYPLNDFNYQRILLERMTQHEQDNIINQSFNTMWDNLWMESIFPQKSVQSRKYKENSSHKHNKIKEIWFDTGKIDSEWSEPEWGLPKGRRNKNETDLEVSLREFNEETGIRLSNIEIIPSDVIKEDYVANNGHHYTNNYLIAKWSGDHLLDMNELQIRNKDKYSYCAEIRKIDVCSISEIMDRLRYYEEWKQKLFSQCFSVIHSKEEDESIDRPRD